MPKEKYQRPPRHHTIMSAADIAAGKPSSWFSLEIRGSVRCLCPEILQFRHITSLDLNNNRLVDLPAQISRLVHLTFLDVSSNNLLSIPSELGDLTEMRELLLSNNQLRTLPYELGKLFNLFNLEIKGNPLNPEYIQLYQNVNGMNGTQSLLNYMFERLPFNASVPPQRLWIPINQNQDRSHPAARFTVMCYNVLCDKYCTRQQYGYCPSWALNWEYRKKGIIEHILNLNATIISLQEVETEQYNCFFKPQLRQVGYDGIFSPKSRARTMSEQESRHVDGCAIFYKRDKFRLVEEKLVEFNRVAMANAEGSDDMVNRVMTKDNIALCALLETKPGIFENCPIPPEPLCRQMVMVSTAHIHWDPQYSDVKMVQTMMLMWELQKFVEEATCKYNLPYPGPYTCNSIPFVFCGDLNSLPNSGVIEFLSNGKVAVNHKDFKDNAYDQVMKKMCSGDKTHIYHNFKLSRAYGDIMPVTNYTYDFKGIIDYIFHSRDWLKVLGHLGPYKEEWFRDNKVIGVPHPHIPSDHFSLLVEFELPIQPPVIGRGPPPPLSNKNR